MFDIGAKYEVVYSLNKLKRETVGEKSEEPLGGIQVWCDASAIEVTVKSWFAIFKKSFELVEMKVKTGHVVRKHISQSIFRHEFDKHAKSFFFTHLIQH